MKLDLLTVGDATIDTFLFIHDAQIMCTLKKDACQLCVNYADKLPVEKIVRTVAGNAANNSVGAARLGLKTALVTQLGDDNSGQWIYKKLREEKVGTACVVIDKKLETNSSTVLSFKGERTIFVYHAPRVYALPKKIPRARFIYYTSVGPKHSNLSADVVRYVRSTGALLAFNPGTHQIRAGLSTLKPVLGVCEILFVNKEEALRIVGEKKSMVEYLSALHALGPKTVVITNGSDGAHAFDDGAFYQIGVPKIKVLERTGAGDSFASAFIAARVYGKSVPESLCWGTMNATSVIMHVGPQEGLLSHAGIESFHKKIKHVCAQKI